MEMPKSIIGKFWSMIDSGLIIACQLQFMCYAHVSPHGILFILKTYVKFSITWPLKIMLTYMLTNQISTGLMVKTNPHYTNQLRNIARASH